MYYQLCPQTPKLFLDFYNLFQPFFWYIKSDEKTCSRKDLKKSPKSSANNVLSLTVIDFLLFQNEQGPTKKLVQSEVLL